MGFNFRKSIKIAPGVKLNLSNKGISSVSAGGKGVRVTVGRKAVRTTVGLGGGLSYSKSTSYNSKKKKSVRSPANCANQQAQAHNSPTPLYNGYTTNNFDRDKRIYITVGLIILFTLIIINIVG